MVGTVASCCISSHMRGEIHLGSGLGFSCDTEQQLRSYLQIQRRESYIIEVEESSLYDV